MISDGSGLLEWIYKNKIVNERGDPIEFDAHSFLLEPYSNWHPKLAVIKSAQIGFSTLAIIKSLYALGHMKMNIIYTLPNFDDVEDFVPPKVNKMIKVNPCISSMIGDSDAVKQKQVGGNTIWYRGTHKEKAAIMHSSDWNMYDELDASNQKVIDVYSSRLQYSKFKGESWFSNPTIPSFGISQKYDDSDQRRWIINCSRCNAWQDMRWPDNVDYEQKVFICRKCKKELSEEDRHDGEWVASFSGREIHGYHISQLMCPWVTASELIALENTKSPRVFHNMILGLPFVEKDDMVDRVDIIKNVTTKRNSQLKNAMGVDQKIRVKHVIIGNHEGIFYVGTVKTWDEVRALKVKFNAVMVVDGNPDPEARKLPKEFVGSAFCCFYRKDKEKKDIVWWGEKDNFGFVYADRTNCIQQVIDSYKRGEIKINTNGTDKTNFIKNDLDEYLKHWKNIYRKTELDTFGIPKSSWEKNGEDDFVHASVYFWLALSKVPKPVVHQGITPGIIWPEGMLPSHAHEIIDGKIPAGEIPLFPADRNNNQWLSQ